MAGWGDLCKLQGPQSKEPRKALEEICFHGIQEPGLVPTFLVLTAEPSVSGIMVHSKSMRKCLLMVSHPVPCVSRCLRRVCIEALCKVPYMTSLIKMGPFSREAMLKGLGQQSSTRGSRPLLWVEGPFHRGHQWPTEKRDMCVTDRSSGIVTPLRKEGVKWLQVSRHHHNTRSQHLEGP